MDSVFHRGPSTIDIHTLVRSKGKIPDVFLRGAGVPEPFITNMKSLISAVDPIQFYSLFISYSTANQEFAARLHADLQAKGIRCWFAPHDIQGGKKMHEQIDEAIRLHDKLLLILSPQSMDSEWVKTEISKARKREVRDKARVLFPVRLAPFEVLRDWECFDADTGKDSAREIREFFIPDFSTWKVGAVCTAPSPTILITCGSCCGTRCTCPHLERNIFSQQAVGLDLYNPVALAHMFFEFFAVENPDVASGILDQSRILQVARCDRYTLPPPTQHI